MIARCMAVFVGRRCKVLAIGHGRLRLREDLQTCRSTMYQQNVDVVMLLADGPGRPLRSAV